MFKLKAFNPLTQAVYSQDWTLEGFQNIQEALQMGELLINEGFEDVAFAGLMSEFEIKTWHETGVMAGLPADPTPAQVWEMRVKNRPELIDMRAVPCHA